MAEPYRSNSRDGSNLRYRSNSRDGSNLQDAYRNQKKVAATSQKDANQARLIAALKGVRAGAIRRGAMEGALPTINDNMSEADLVAAERSLRKLAPAAFGPNGPQTDPLSIENIEAIEKANAPDAKGAQPSGGPANPTPAAESGAGRMRSVAAAEQPPERAPAAASPLDTLPTPRPTAGVANPPPMNNTRPGQANTATLAERRTVYRRPLPPALTGPDGNAATDAANLQQTLDYFAPGGGLETQQERDNRIANPPQASAAVRAGAGTGRNVADPKYGTASSRFVGPGDAAPAVVPPNVAIPTVASADTPATPVGTPLAPAVSATPALPPAQPVTPSPALTQPGWKIALDGLANVADKNPVPAGSGPGTEPGWKTIARLASGRPTSAPAATAAQPAAQPPAQPATPAIPRVTPPAAPDFLTRSARQQLNDNADGATALVKGAAAAANAVNVVKTAGANLISPLAGRAAIAATKAAAAGASGLDALNQPPAAPAAPTQRAAGLVAGPMTMKSFTGPMATPVRPGPNGLAPGPLDQLDTPLGSTSMTEDPAASFAKSPEDAKFKKKLAFSGGSEGK